MAEWALATMDHATSQDNQQLEAFGELVLQWQQRKGSDGRPAFSIPVAHCSPPSPEIRALTNIFALTSGSQIQGFELTHTKDGGFRRPGTRDDYGTLLQGTSAWAGLHYHCSRRPWMGRNRGIMVLIS